MQKLAAGRIDGYIFSGSAIDPIIQKLGMTNIHREVYKQFDVAGALAKAAKGGPVDQMFTKAMQAVADDAAFKAEIAKVTAAYRGPDWQMS
jgi:polar amino acid transport system substrate-binding protein